MASILVMMSSYNGSDYIRPQIISIMEQQTDHDISLRIRDDGSKDNTCKIIKELCSCYPGRIELICGNNIGSNASFFDLINTAEGFDYYAISDQDDVFLPNKYDIACNALRELDNTKPLLFSSTSFLVQDNLVPYGKTREKEREFTIYNTIIQNICPGHNQVFNNELLNILKQVEKPELVYVYDMWITNTAILYGSVVFTNEPLSYYRQHNNNLMGTRSGKLGKLFVSCKRLLAGDGDRTRQQIDYFVEMNKDKLEEKGYYDELKRFLNSRSFVDRWRYILHSKLYRQTRIETISFKLAVLSGKY